MSFTSKMSKENQEATEPFAPQCPEKMPHGLIVESRWEVLPSGRRSPTRHNKSFILSHKTK